MLQNHLEDIIYKHFTFDFSDSQKKAVGEFLDFLYNKQGDGLFVLKGYAGTGKTSLVAAFIKTLIEYKTRVVLLAPTGRAAKVFSAYAGVPAYTVHKMIYRQKGNVDGEGDFSIGFNKYSNTLFFVDEASMISNSGYEDNFGSGRLLDDLVEFVYNGRNNRMVLIGDIAQLPPVGLSISPALDIDYLYSEYHLDISEVNMAEVMRQRELSGILYNATQVRQLIRSGSSDLRLKVEGFPDVFRITGTELLEELDMCYGRYGLEETMVICMSNKRANKYNEGIRRMILYREEEFGRDDRIMVVKNNYYWKGKGEDADFIANGELATVQKVKKYTDIYGHRFVQADIYIDDTGETLTSWMLLDTLTSDAPALTTEESKLFYRKVEEDYMEITSRKKRFEKVRDNSFYNALQIKFAYAVTCHKAQGGQWDVVFVDQGWLTNDMMNDNYWRWLYTAITRAKKRLYFVNFKENLFN